MTTSEQPPRAAIRAPRTEDGAGIWKLVRDSGVLDLNSAYLYLLLCKDFADTCRVAETEGRLVGFVTAYRPPGRPEVLFVWQIGVAVSQRGQGLGGRLLRALAGADACRGVSALETTISPSNAPSRGLFESLARRLDARISEEPCFEEEIFPEEGHEAEPLLRIGPFTEERRAALSAD
jgi:L-2,4-diaminobutyric acid acetyltransferase